MPDSAPVDAAGVAFASPGAPNTPRHGDDGQGFDAHRYLLNEPRLTENRKRERPPFRSGYSDTAGSYPYPPREVAAESTGA